MIRNLLQSALVASALIATSLILGCGDSGSTPPAVNKTKVALILFGSSSDGGWNQLAADTMTEIAKKENLDLDIKQSIKAEQAPDLIRSLDSKGNALIIANGHEYQAAAEELSDPA